MRIKKSDIKKHYEWLNHKRETEIRIITPEEVCTSVFVHNFEELLELCKKHIGKNHLYIAINERKPKGTKAKDIEKITNFVVDIDNKDNFLETQELALRIKEEAVEQGFKEPLLNCSGGGFHIYFALEETPNNEKTQEQIKAFGKRLKDKYETKNSEIDSAVFEVARVMRLAGSINVKPNVNSPCFVINPEVKRENDSLLTEQILAIKPEERVASAGKVSSEFLEKLKRNKKVWNLFNGILKGYKSRSEAEQSLVCHLIGLNFNKEEVFQIMASSKTKKWTEANVNYRELTYKKAVEIISKKKNTTEERIKSFLQEEPKKFESLGGGYHDGIYYFGTKVWKGSRPYTAIVTSDKKFYVNTLMCIDKKWVGVNEIKALFGLNYRHEFYEEALDNLLSKEVIDKWIYGNTEEINFKSIYEKLIKIFKKYIYFEDKRKYSVVACYRIAGFFMPVWRARARLFLFGEYGTSKSRLTNILHNTGFNSVNLGDWTLAFLKTIIESTRGETHIDDFETLNEELKGATTRLVKVGYMKGFKAGKMSEGKRKPEVNDLFNTTTLNNTEGVDFISADRCVTIRIPKIAKKEYDIEPNFEHKIWKELREELYILGLKCPNEVKEVYENLKSDKIRGRLFSIIKPELTIAKLISDKLHKQIEEWWVGEIEQRSQIDYETDWEFLAFTQIYKVLSTFSTSSTLSTLSTHSTQDNYFNLFRQIIEPVGLSLYGEETFQKKKKRSMSIIIGKILSRNPIFKKRQVKGVTQYTTSLKDFEALLEAKGFLEQIKQILEVE